MQIVVNFAGAFNPSTSSLTDAIVLRALLDMLVKADLAYLRDHSTTSIYASGVVYGRTTEWDSIPDCIARTFGDCKTLSCWRIAELIRQGIPAEPEFRWARRFDGAKDFHILIRTPKGYEDPSRKLGMGADEVAKFYK